MNNLLRITITPEQDGRSIKQILREDLHFSMHQISRIKYRPGGFLVDGVPCYVNSILREGQTLCFRLDDEPLPPCEDAPPAQGECRLAACEDALRAHGECGAPPLPILYEDDFLLAADKPQGMVSHPSHGHHGDSALDLLQKTCGRLYLIGRLDKDTSGVLLFARHRETASVLSAQKAGGLLEKTYLAAVKGILLPENGSIDLPIGIEKENPLKMKTDPMSGKPAATHYRTLRVTTDRNGDAVSILSVRIEHGRTHQIRVHLAGIGHPLVGDALYGRDASLPAPGQFAHLHAASLRLTHPYTGAEIFVTAALPSWAADSSLLHFS